LFLLPRLKVRTERRERMLRLALVIVLVVATASARHVKKERRNNGDSDDSDPCNSEDHPLRRCSLDNSSEYPTIGILVETASPEEAKRLLKEEGILENFCSEGKKYLPCVREALKSVSDECHEEYKRQRLLSTYYDKMMSFLTLMCTAENIQTIRENVDCLINEQLYQTVGRCQYQNPDQDCSHLPGRLDVSPGPQQQELNKCYEEKFRLNCNAASVVLCASNAVKTTCTREAGDLVSQAGTAYFARFEICPLGSGTSFKSLLKFFRK